MKKQNHRGWIVTAIVLLVIFAGLIVISFKPNPAVSGKIKLQLTVVYNSASTEQKSKMELFLDNLTEPSTALQNTELQTKWLDSKSSEAQALIAKSKQQYLPQIFLDKSVEQHPQFDNLKEYLNKQDDLYFMRLAPLEHLSVPAAAEGQVVGADLDKAKVVIQAYESYLCDYCATVNDTLKKVLKNYPKTVAVVYKHFESQDIFNVVAQGAECAADQNKFSQMQDTIFKGQTGMIEKLETAKDQADAEAILSKLFGTYAKNLGLNLKNFQNCLAAKTHAKAIDAQTLDAINYGINGPPAFFINDQYRGGLLSYDEFKTIIDSELQ